MPGSYYTILEVTANASPGEIRKAYRKMAKKYHPDKNPDNRAVSEAKFKELGEAYEILSNETTRKIYDNNGGFFSKLATLFRRANTPCDTEKPVVKMPGKSFIVYIKLYLMEDAVNYQDLDFQTYLAYFKDGFPQGFSPHNKIRFQTFVYTEEELVKCTQTKNYDNEKWKQLHLPPAISRFVLECDLAKESVEKMLTLGMEQELEHHIVKAKEDLITLVSNKWECQFTQNFSRNTPKFESFENIADNCSVCLLM